MNPYDEEIRDQQSVDILAARNLATTTKTVPQLAAITPRWFLKLLPWIQVESGTYRVNRTKVVQKARERLEPMIQEGQVMILPRDLRRIPIFHDLDDSLLQSMADRFECRELGPSELIMQEGDAGDRFYIIADGRVEVTVLGARGEPLRVDLKTRGDYFGEVSLVRDVPRTATLRTLTRSTLLALSRSDFQEIVDRAPELRGRFEQSIVRSLANVERVKKDVNEYGEKRIDLKAGHYGEPDLPETFVDYEMQPREYPLNVVQTIVQVHTRVSDIYNEPINQLREQLRLTMESMKERQEWEMINNQEFGLLHAATADTRLQPRYGPPTPDEMDGLLSIVWKKPAFFLAHPLAIAAFGRECTRRGVPPPTVQMYGTPFLTWRGVPLVPCDKLEVSGTSGNGRGPGRTNILLMRVGEAEQGVVGLHHTGLPGEQRPGLSVRFMGINRKSIASYMLTLYFSCAVLVADALAVLENVEIGYHHDYS